MTSETHDTVATQLLMLGVALRPASRVRLLMALASGSPKSMTQLREETDLSVGALSTHVHLLAAAGLVAIDRMGREGCVGLRPGWEPLVAGLINGLEALAGEAHYDDDLYEVPK